jgi:hypothetical protein
MNSKEEADQIMKDIQELVLAPWEDYSFIFSEDKDMAMLSIEAPEWTLLMASACEVRGYECDIITIKNNKLQLSYIRDIDGSLSERESGMEQILS